MSGGIPSGGPIFPGGGSLAHTPAGDVGPTPDPAVGSPDAAARGAVLERSRSLPPDLDGRLAGRPMGAGWTPGLASPDYDRIGGSRSFDRDGSNVSEISSLTLRDDGSELAQLTPSPSGVLGARPADPPAEEVEEAAVDLDDVEDARRVEGLQADMQRLKTQEKWQLAAKIFQGLAVVAGVVAAVLSGGILPIVAAGAAAVVALLDHYGVIDSLCEKAGFSDRTRAAIKVLLGLLVMAGGGVAIGLGVAVAGSIGGAVGNALSSAASALPAAITGSVAVGTAVGAAGAANLLRVAADKHVDPPFWAGGEFEQVLRRGVAVEEWGAGALAEYHELAEDADRGREADQAERDRRGVGEE